MITLVRAGGLCQVSRDASAQRDVTDSSKHVSEKVGLHDNLNSDCLYVLFQPLFYEVQVCTAFGISRATWRSSIGNVKIQDANTKFTTDFL